MNHGQGEATHEGRAAREPARTVCQLRARAAPRVLRPTGLDARRAVRAHLPRGVAYVPDVEAPMSDAQEYRVDAKFTSAWALRAAVQSGERVLVGDASANGPAVVRGETGWRVRVDVADGVVAVVRPGYAPAAFIETVLRWSPVQRTVDELRVGDIVVHGGEPVVVHGVALPSAGQKRRIDYGVGPRRRSTFLSGGREVQVLL